MILPSIIVVRIAAAVVVDQSEDRHKLFILISKFMVSQEVRVNLEKKEAGVAEPAHGQDLQCQVSSRLRAAQGA